MKKQKIYSLAVAICMTATVNAQTGGISSKMLGEIQKQNKMTPAENAIANAIATIIINFFIIFFLKLLNNVFTKVASLLIPGAKLIYIFHLSKKNY